MGQKASASAAPPSPPRVLVLGAVGPLNRPRVRWVAGDEEAAVASSAPCIGFEVEECTVDNATWTTWSVGGSGTNFRDIERLYYSDVAAIVWVVSAAAPSREIEELSSSRNLLEAKLAEPGLDGVPLLVLCLATPEAPGDARGTASNEQQIAEQLGLSTTSATRDTRVCVVSAEAATGDAALRDAIKWLRKHSAKA